MDLRLRDEDDPRHDGKNAIALTHKLTHCQVQRIETRIRAEFVGLTARISGEAILLTNTDGNTQPDVLVALRPNSNGRQLLLSGAFSESWPNTGPDIMTAFIWIGRDSRVEFHNVTVEVPVLTQA